MERPVSISPSNLHRRERCPGSFAAESAIPINPDHENEVANKGNRLHSEIAAGILHVEKRTAILIDSEEPDIVKACWGEATACWNSLTVPQQTRARVLIEKEVDLKFLGMERLGTPDFAIIVPGTDTESGFVILRDWKSGQGWVAGARWNLQLLAYAVGLCAQYGIEGSANVGVFQPLVRTYSDAWTATREDLATVAEKIKRVVAVCTEWDSPPVIPGGHCIYCRASARCESRCMVAAEVKQIANPVETFKMLAPENRKTLYEDIGRAIKILEKTQEQIDDAILKGEIEVAGYGIGEGRKGRFWACQNPIETLTEIARVKGLTLNDVVEPISVSAAEKLLGKKEVENLVGVKVGNPNVKQIKTKN